MRTLELIANQPTTQADLARHLDVHRRTARRLLARLVAEGYADHRQDGPQETFTATGKVVALGRIAAGVIDLVDLCRRAFEGDGGDWGGAVYVAYPNQTRDWLVRRDAAESNIDLFDNDSSARKLSHHATAEGKCFLAADGALLTDTLSRGLLTFTDRTIVERADLLLALATIRTSGYAIEDREHRPSIRCVASGIKDHSGRTIAALVVQLDNAGNLSELGVRIAKAASAVAVKIGAPTAGPPAQRAPVRSRS